MTTLIWLISDLHLEALDHETWDPGARPDFDVLACAGDVVESNPAACVDAVARLAGGKPAVLVLGNHDCWNLALEDALAEAVARNPLVHVLDAEPVEIGGVTFAGGTLWDDPDDWPPGIPRVKATDATQSGEPIFVRSEGGRRHATLRDLADRHVATMDAIASAGADVVLTHYPPSEADLARLATPTIWLHGHQHSILNERQGMHQVTRMPCRHSIDLVGAVVGVTGGRPPYAVTPVVGLRTSVPKFAL